MAKRDQAAEKRKRNEEYALKYQKKPDLAEQAAQRELRWKGGPWANWCRTKGHPKECNCAYG